MADRKISDLTALTTPASGDYLPIVDISESAAASKNKRITIQSLFQGIPVNVGIGTSSPVQALDVGSGNITLGSTLFSGSGASTGDVAFEHGGNRTGSGNVYIDLHSVSGGDFQSRILRYGGANGALSIVNTGTGNFIITQVNAAAITFGTDNLERARIDSSGRLLVGTSTARNNFFNLGVYTAKHLVEGTGGTGAGRGSLAIVNNSTAATDPGYLVFGRTKGSTAGSNTVLAADDWVGMISFQGSDGTEFVECAQINAYIDGAPGANDMPGRLVFSTTADGASSPTERMRIDSSGRVGIGTSSPTTLLDVNADTVRVRTARTPASATATGDAGEICWDANYIYVCTATNTWKRAALSTW